MTTPIKLYQKELHSNFGFFANWLPGDPIEVGAIGTISQGRFRQEAKLSDLQIKAELTEESSSSPLKYHSTSGMKISTDADLGLGNVSAQFEVGIEFSNEGAFLFEAMGLRQVQIDNRFEVAARILDEYEKKKWKSEWYLIDSMYFSDSLTVLISQDSEAEIKFVSGAGFALQALSLADPRLSLSTSLSRGSVFQIVAGSHMRPLYSCLRLRDRWFRSADIIPVHGNEKLESAINNFHRAPIDDLLNS